MELQQITDLLKKEFLKLLIIQLKSGRLALQQSKSITKEFLSLMPFTDVSNMKEKIHSFTEKYTDFGSLYLLLLKMQEEERLGSILTKMRGYMQKNKIDEALKLVK